MNTARIVVKNTTVLLFGRALSLGLGIVYVAVLARYVQAAGMGKIATATSLVSILILLANFGLSQLVIRDVASDKAKASTYVLNALLLRVLLSVVFGIVIVGITAITKYPYDTTVIIYIYGFVYILDELTDVAFSIFKAFERMEYPAAIQSGRDIANVVLSLGAIYLRASLITIVLASAVASFLKLVVSLAVLRRRFVRPRLQIDRDLCRQLVVAALPFAALVFIPVVNRQIDTVVLSLYHSEEEVGWFSAANTLITYLLLVPNTFLQAIFPVFARFHSSSRDALRQAYRTFFKYLLLLGSALCVGTIVTADQVIALVYGPGFESAVLALRILAFQLFWMFGFANGALLNATGGQTFLAAIMGAGAALNVVLAFLLIPRFSFVGASIAPIASAGVLFFPITLACHRRLGARVPYALAIKSLLSSVLMGVVVALFLRAQINLFLVVLAIAPVVHGVLLVIFRAIGHEDILMLTHLFRRRTDLANTGEIPASG